MSKRAPSTTQLLVITVFALACFGILLFLWITFGGPTPFKAKSYQVKVPFTEASQLAEQSDVRISGVDVGKVESIELGPNGHESIEPHAKRTRIVRWTSEAKRSAAHTPVHHVGKPRNRRVQSLDACYNLGQK